MIMYYASELAGEELPFNTDQWDGYPREREEFYKNISNLESNLILAGDSTILVFEFIR